MKTLARSAAVILCLTAMPALAQTPPPTHDSLARNVERAEGIRAVKNLQRTYAQYAQFGLWNEVASLYADDGVMDFGEGVFKGHTAIADFMAKRFGDGRQGLMPGAVHTTLIESPVINLSADGNTAKGRWAGFYLQADGKGGASIEGGMYENDYVKERGVWKIAELHFHPQYNGPYETGWSNIGGKDLPIIPYHFDGDGAGIPIPAPTGEAPRNKASLANLEERIRVMNDEDKVRNLQAAYQNYVDRKMWDDVADLFASNGVLEVGGVGVYDGPARVRQAMERMGPAGLTHGQLNDHLVFDDVAQILPGGREARTRGIELGMVADADSGAEHWEVNVFDNRFVKEDGIWKVREMRIYPLLRSEYHEGWGKSRLPEPMPTGEAAPDHPVPAADQGSEDEVIPAFHAHNPVTGKMVALPPAKKFVGVAALTGTIATAKPAAPPADASARLADDARRLMVSTAYDGVENVSTAYGEYADDFQWPELAQIFGKRGAKEVPFAGYYVGHDRIAQSVFLEYGDAVTTGRTGIAFHWRIEPVINVASDGRSASVRTYLFHPDTSKVPARASIENGMYLNDQLVLEDGIWRLWNLSLDEPYFNMPGGWKGGWTGTAAPRPPRPATPATPRPGPQHYIGAALVDKFPPDVKITDLGKVEEHYRGGTGETWSWPQILPMWWGYKNPVSGRTPENFIPDCVPCDYAPDLSMAKHGYLLPPTGPQDAAEH